METDCWMIWLSSAIRTCRPAWGEAMSRSGREGREAVASEYFLSRSFFLSSSCSRWYALSRSSRRDASSSSRDSKLAAVDFLISLKIQKKKKTMTAMRIFEMAASRVQAMILANSPRLANVK
jgi:hypothetical protein